MPAKTAFPKEKIEMLLLEGVHSQGIGRLKEEGFAIETRKRAFSEADLEAAALPSAALPELSGSHRTLRIHGNVPGVLQKVNAMFGEAGINVAAQHLRTSEDIGYLIMDTEKATRNLVRPRL